jgi:hypothetical protein
MESTHYSHEQRFSISVKRNRPLGRHACRCGLDRVASRPRTSTFNERFFSMLNKSAGYESCFQPLRDTANVSSFYWRGSPVRYHMP